MKKVLFITLALVLTVAMFASCTSTTTEEVVEETPVEATEEVVEEVAEEEVVEEATGEVITLSIGYYADAADSYYQLGYDALVGMAAADPECDWTIDFTVGQGTADEQLTAVENYIIAGYDAILVVPNNTETTSECIAKCTDAGIPYFGLTHSFFDADNASDAAGFAGYDFTYEGYLAGEDAVSRGVSEVIMIEGVLGQGTAGAQTLGFLQAYEDAGVSLGGLTAEELAAQKSEAVLDGTQELEIVYWGSGEWMSDPAQKAMTDAITSLGADGFDGAYVQNNPMVEGAILAMTDAGLDISNYWLASGNGREISWQWAIDGLITMDVNQPAALEGALVYQQIKAYFTGEDYKQYVYPYLTPYTTENINDVIDTLVPCTDVDAFLAGVADGSIIWELDNDKFEEVVF